MLSLNIPPKLYALKNSKDVGESFSNNIKTDEVIQVYIKNHDSKLAVRNHSLCGFKRVKLNPLQEKTVEITIPSRAFMTVNEDGKYIVSIENKDEGIQEYSLNEILDQCLGTEISLTSIDEVV